MIRVVAGVLAGLVLLVAPTAGAFTKIRGGMYQSYGGPGVAPPAPDDRSEGTWGLRLYMDPTGTYITAFSAYIGGECAGSKAPRAAPRWYGYSFRPSQKAKALKRFHQHGDRFALTTGYRGLTFRGKWMSKRLARVTASIKKVAEVEVPARDGTRKMCSTYRQPFSATQTWKLKPAAGWEPNVAAK